MPEPGLAGVTPKCLRLGWTLLVRSKACTQLTEQEALPGTGLPQGQDEEASVAQRFGLQAFQHCKRGSADKGSCR